MTDHQTAPMSQTASRTGTKTLIFHTGDHKTGSTSIQVAFAKGLVSVEGHSVYYPATLASNVIGSHCQNYAHPEKRKARKKAIAWFEAQADRIRRSTADFVLISAEALEGVDPVLFREIVDTFFADTADEIRVLCYVRPHAARMTSSFAERTKVGAMRVLEDTLEDFCRRKMAEQEFIYLPRFMAWREQFGAAYHLRPMIRDQLHNGSVVDDFAHHAFGGLPCSISADSTANESLCLEDLMRLKVLQRTLRASRRLGLKVGWEFSRLIGDMPPPSHRTKLRLHKSLAKEIRVTCLADARNMDETFFDGAPLLQQELFKEEENALSRPQSVEPKDILPESELRSLEIMSRMVAGLLEKDGVDWGPFLHAKRVADVKLARKAAAKAE